MLAIGVAVGAAIGPAPTASFAGDTPALIARLLLRARIAQQRGDADREHHGAAAAAATPRAPRRRRQRADAGRGGRHPASSAGSEAATAEQTVQIQHAGQIEAAGDHERVADRARRGRASKKPLAQAAAAPYITGQLIPTGTLLSSWSAIEGSAFANEAALAAPASAVGTPPLVHSIVQPPCPEGAAGRKLRHTGRRADGGRRIR